MKIYLIDQRTYFGKHLDQFKQLDVMAYEKTDLTARVSSIQIHADRSLRELDLTSFFNYEIFPANILTFRTQWQSEMRAMRVGDSIVQQIYLPPLPKLSQKIIVGVRVNEVIKEKHLVGFSYKTLQGHVEKGVSSFLLEQRNDGLYFTIRTLSAPGNVLSKLLGPLFSVPYQKFCTAAALRNVKAQFEFLS